MNEVLFKCLLGCFFSVHYLVPKEKVWMKADCFSTMALPFLWGCVLKGKSLDLRSVKHYVPVPRQLPTEYASELRSKGLSKKLPDELTLGNRRDSEKVCQVQNVLKGNIWAQIIFLCFTRKFLAGMGSRRKEQCFRCVVCVVYFVSWQSLVAVFRFFIYQQFIQKLST